MAIKTQQHLTGLAVSRHNDPKRPLLDGACPGLRLHALPVRQGQQRKSWIYRYRSKDGRVRQLKLGEYPAMGLADARKVWRQQKTIRDDPSQGDPRARLEQRNAAKHAEARLAREKRYKVEELCRDYLQEHVDVRRSNTREARRLLEREVIPQLGHKPAVSLRTADVHGVIQTIIGRDAPRVAQMARAELKAAFNHAVSAGRLPEDHPNPCARVKVPTYVRRNRAFSEAELAKFLAWLPKARVSRTVRETMLLELLTAARQGEIVSMCWQDIDLARAVWTQPTSKNGQPHDVMLSAQAVALIQARQGLNLVWVFPRPDGTGHVASKAIGIQQYAAKTDLDIADWTVHDLRRSALTGLARLGCPRVVQDRIANHRDSSVAAIYDRHRYDAEARIWLQRWADELDVTRLSLNTSRLAVDFRAKEVAHVAAMLS